jgi:uncharacterized protein
MPVFGKDHAPVISEANARLAVSFKTPPARRGKHPHQSAMRSDIMANAENDRRIDYIEFGVADIERSKAFYGKAFGWTFKDYGPTYCEFSDGRLTGGFTTETASRPGGPLVILYGVDLTDLQKRVEAAGGRIAKPIFDFPGGQRFHFLDPDGYELAMWTKQ